MKTRVEIWLKQKGIENERDMAVPAMSRLGPDNSIIEWRYSLAPPTTEEMMAITDEETVAYEKEQYCDNFTKDPNFRMISYILTKLEKKNQNPEKLKDSIYKICKNQEEPCGKKNAMFTGTGTTVFNNSDVFNYTPDTGHISLKNTCGSEHKITWNGTVKAGSNVEDTHVMSFDIRVSEQVGGTYTSLGGSVTVSIKANESSCLNLLYLHDTTDAGKTYFYRLYSKTITPFTICANSGDEVRMLVETMN